MFVPNTIHSFSHRILSSSSSSITFTRNLNSQQRSFLSLYAVKHHWESDRDRKSSKGERRDYKTRIKSKKDDEVKNRETLQPLKVNQELYKGLVIERLNERVLVQKLHKIPTPPESRAIETKQKVSPDNQLIDDETDIENEDESDEGEEEDDFATKFQEYQIDFHHSLAKSQQYSRKNYFLCFQSPKIIQLERLVPGDYVDFHLIDENPDPISPPIDPEIFSGPNANELTPPFPSLNQNSEYYKGIITSFSPRLNVLSRPYSAHDSRKKIILKPIASNIQQLFIVVATRPIVPIATIDRYIVMARLLGIPKIYLVINKFDYLEESEAFYKSIRFYEDSLQIPMIKTSIKNHLGLDKISSLLINRSSIFVGQSGVGKSSFINLLLPHLAIKANPLVKNDQYGAHTTSNAKLYHFYSKDTNSSIDSKEYEVSDGSRILPCPEGLHHGVILDSPGVRELGTWHLSSDQITEGFEEIAEHAKQCRYRNCDHLPEEGGDNNKKQCAVIEGVYEKKIHPSRYRSYLTLLQQLMQ